MLFVVFCFSLLLFADINENPIWVQWQGFTCSLQKVARKKLTFKRTQTDLKTLTCCCDTGQIKRMWVFIILYIAGLNNCVTCEMSSEGTESNKSSAAKSYQMYYIKLNVDKHVMENVTEILKPFKNHSMNFQVDNLRMTTVCERVSPNRVCKCEPEYRWSDDVCQSNQCCNDNCTFSEKSNHTCISNKTGAVTMTGLEDPVKYNSKHNITCSTLNPDVIPMWWHNQFNKITNGSESRITVNVGSGTIKSWSLSLFKITELWAGKIECRYQNKINSIVTNYFASGVLDVAVLPIIDITTHPQFPRCQNEDVQFEAKCTIQRSAENYTVTWASQSVTILQNTHVRLANSLVYQSKAVIDCNSLTQNLEMTCMFENRLGQNRSATVTINVIGVGDKYCPAEDDWEDTKAGFRATLKCDNEEGNKWRKCSNSTVWEQVESECVHMDVYNMHKRATQVGIGIGTLEENAEGVISSLSNITNQTETMRTFANMNFSVDVLSILSKKEVQVNQEMTVEKLVFSSSNLMETSYETLWKEQKREDNMTLAEIYLESIEKLISKANITDIIQKDNVEVVVCKNYNVPGKKCTNEVLNATVNLESTEVGNVTTTGFKQLDKYLPNNYDAFDPSSIVVSTTFSTESKASSSVSIEIVFPMFCKRPPNVEVKCVSWDNVTKSWSDQGCQWKGASHEGSCICNHLSTFAILMAKKPLKVPFLHDITLAGVSVSIISLVLSLLTELSVWALVVKSNTLYLRHTAHINISLCLLIAHCCFLASLKPEELPPTLCSITVVLKHFFYLSVFFWMLCLSTTLIHQAVFLFHEVSRGTYLKFSMVLGYVCPFLIVFITFLSNNIGKEGSYFSKDTCWLVYRGFHGSMITFLIPVGVIVFINMMFMLVVILKLIDHPMNTGASNEKKSHAVKAVMRSLVLLTPIFGITWMLGFGVTNLDLTSGPIAYAVNYAFVITNAFQGLFIFLTTCPGDKMVREALLKRLKLRKTESTSVCSTNLNSTEKN
ncbi:adhesion G-protein coupled receptor F3 isoform X3 [Cynoglossus semilaevis]|uniref:adhesion G-protein coupled receptor F3 isoform X3 n=1 Tax=Cynoglossus semilaevis TaxID=244447 RepID=UPI0007DCA584|nr:adhesion G-protein coupled receptor F3-like isoform X3 [Cynoglossus semilaevis]